MPNRKDRSAEIGSKTAMLTRLSGNNNGWATYRCDCGKDTRTRSCSVDSGLTKSCGCLHKFDLTGAKFGMLTFVQRVLDSNDHEKRALWRCDCGSFHDARISHVKKGSTRSCGCAKGRILFETHRARKPYNHFARHRHNYRKAALDRGFSFELDLKEFTDIASRDCHYCGATPRLVRYLDKCKSATREERERYANGIDRVDNAKGYSRHNCVPCCKRCNYAKRDVSYADFVAWIDQLVAHQAEPREKQLTLIASPAA
jgi:hypothetical protein